MTKPAHDHSTITDPLRDRFLPRLKRFEKLLEKALPDPEAAPARLHQAMNYAVLGGGKRIRPLLTYASARALHLADEQVDAIAIAVELIHAYSLVHDDLPAMDDDDLRRGRPTCHRRFDEATAILAGDALQALAFELLAADPALAQSPPGQVRVIHGLAAACGSRGMAGGQAHDLAAVGKTLARNELEAMHRLKTGALIRFATVAPAWFSTTDGGVRAALHRYGSLVGLAFQIHDDVLDVVGEEQRIGKPVASDSAQAKPTFAGILGLDASRHLAGRLCRQALACLEPLGPAADELAFIANYVVSRDR